MKEEVRTLPMKDVVGGSAPFQGELAVGKAGAKSEPKPMMQWSLR